MSPAASATSSAAAAPSSSTSGGGGGGGGGGFQYKPPSYLLRASDTTNRPWNGNGTENDVRSSSTNEENEYDLPQEQRPQTRRESYVDAHFHQRVRTKQSRYRDIITGETAEGNSNSSSSSSSNQHAVQQDDDDDDDDDSVLLAAANVDSLDSFSRVRSEKQHLTQASENNTARLNRKERITGITKPNPMKIRSSSSSAPADAETVRSLRAQRLRSNLLKSSSDEFNLQTKLESRRIQSRKDEQNERVASSSTATSSELSSSSSSSVQQQQKYELDKERKAIQLERKALIIAAKKEAASYALQRASQINNERRKQRELNAIIEMNRIEDEKYLKRRSNEQQQQQRIRNSSRSSSSSSSSRNRSNNNKTKTMKTKSFFNNDCGNGANGNDDDMTIFDLDNDFAFLNDISGIVRDSGLMRGCLSVTTGCFGSTTTNSSGGNDINDCYGNDITLCTSTTTAAAAAAADDDDDDIIIDNTNTARSTRTCTRTCTPDLVPCSDTSSSDIEEGDNNNNINNNNNNNCDGNDDNGNNDTDNDNDNNSLRRSRLYAKYRA